MVTAMFSVCQCGQSVEEEGRPGLHRLTGSTAWLLGLCLSFVSRERRDGGGKVVC